ncbi:MAG: aspartyl protease family protein [Tannerellaceae bacterium]|jgi:predicted aspartyl protease|nr:aspartyl protease family protein [Tannerellaceae bacterium]
MPKNNLRVVKSTTTYGNCFTTSYPKISSTLDNDVFLESAIDSNEKLRVKALWDTGANGSLIRPEIATKLNLKSIGKALMSTPSGTDVPSNVYYINLHLPNKVAISEIRVVEGIPNNCDMLIGMDVIGLGDFAVTNYNGKTVFSFRIPSIEKIDFVNGAYFTPSGDIR